MSEATQTDPLAHITEVDRLPVVMFVKYKGPSDKKHRLFMLPVMEIEEDPQLTPSGKAFGHGSTRGFQALGERSPYTGDPLTFSANITSRVAERRS